jgi:hypothetical protein
MFVAIAPLSFIGLGFLFVLAGMDPKSKYGFLGIMFAAMAVLMAVWPYLDVPHIAMR